MSGTLPTSPKPTRVKIRSIQPTLVSVAQSLKRQVRTRGGQRWGINLTYSHRPRSELMAVYGFLMAQRGQYGTFQMTLPGFETPQGSWAGTPVVDGASQTGNTLNIKGLTPSATGIAKCGDFIKCNGHSKVYMVTADANADGAGKAALAIEPKLVTSPADLEAIVYTSVPFTMAGAADNKDFDVSSPVILDFEVDLIEVY